MTSQAAESQQPITQESNVSVAVPVSPRAVSRRSRLRASRDRGGDASRDQASSDETQASEDSSEPNDTTDETGASPPGDQTQQSDTPCRTCRVIITVKARWSASGYSALKTLECQCSDGVVVIRGAVPSYYVKQMAQESIRSVEGVERIVNELSVHDPKATDDRAK